MKMMKTMPRILAVLLATLMLAGTVSLFSGCAGNPGENINSSWTSADTDAVTYFARIVPMSAKAREWFVAASRGYNMGAEGFDDNNLPAPDPSGVSLDGAKKALELVKPKDDPSIVKFNEYVGALTVEQVREVVTRMATSVDLEVKNGFFATILVGVGKFLQVLTKITGGNYVFGLFVFALIVEIVLLPFGIHQQKNSIKQAKLRPREMAIRKKYAGRNDTPTVQKMNQEVQRLYQEEHFNPMGGCLPLLIQMPIVIALYNIVIDPIRYVLGMAGGLSSALFTFCTSAKAAGGLGLAINSNRGTIELLSSISSEQLSGMQQFAFFSNSGACFDALKDISIPNFRLFGVNMGITPGFHAPWGLLAVPVLTFAFYFASMKLTRKLTYQPVTDAQTGCSNNMMDITMPLMSVYISFIVPAAVGVYWIFKCITSTLKQFLLHKVMPLPVFTEEDYKKAEKEIKAKSKTQRKQAGVKTTASGRQVRSLHHIDDDDEPLPPPQHDSIMTKQEKQKKKLEEAEKAESTLKEAEKAPALTEKAEQDSKEEKKEAKEKVEPSTVSPAPLKEDRKTAEKDKKKD